MNESFNKEVDFCYIVDRTFDLLTPTFTASNYECLIDEVYGINDDCTTVNVPLDMYKNIFDENVVAYKLLSEKENAFICLHGNCIVELSHPLRM